MSHVGDNMSEGASLLSFFFFQATYCFQLFIHN